MSVFRKLSPGQIIFAGFFGMILLGTLLLLLPIAQIKPGSLGLIDALFTSTSAVCVTGLVVAGVADTFTVFGRTVIAFLIQIGGLGVACLGVSVMLLAGKRIGMKNRSLLRESWNVGTSQGLIKLLKMVLCVTLGAEAVGAVLTFVSFSKHMPAFDAVGASIFHAVSAFNNAGFDVLGDSSLAPFRGDVLLTLTTAFLIILGGIGFFVIFDVCKKRRLRTLTLHSKIVLFTTLLLLAAGTVLLLLTSDLSFLDSFFYAVSARTAGFATTAPALLSNASVIILCFLMFFGASPGGTGGGIKTTTFFALLNALKGLIAPRKKRQAFKRRLSGETVQKAFLLLTFALFAVFVGILLICAFEPQLPFKEIVFEVFSAFGTVGLSAGITPTLCVGSKLTLIVLMFIGRLGPLTVAALWSVKPELNLSYSEENITIG